MSYITFRSSATYIGCTFVFVLEFHQLLSPLFNRSMCRENRHFWVSQVVSFVFATGVYYNHYDFSIFIFGLYPECERAFTRCSFCVMVYPTLRVYTIEPRLPVKQSPHDSFLPFYLLPCARNGIGSAVFCLFQS